MKPAVRVHVCVRISVWVCVCVYLSEKLPGEMSKTSKLTEVRSEQEHRAP